ncbi:hypothetical protein HKBW3S09_01586, partial [Candidatus Hakubella thermalkaliphila]
PTDSVLLYYSNKDTNIDVYPPLELEIYKLSW